MDGIFQGFLVLIVLVPVLFLAYVTTRFVAGKSSKALKGKYMSIVETLSLGQDKKLHLVKIGNTYVLVSSSGKQVELLTDVKLDDFEEGNVGEDSTPVFDFKKLFDKYIQTYKARKDEPDINKADSGAFVPAAVDASFKKNLHRLRTITGAMDKQGKENGDEHTNEN